MNAQQTPQAQISITEKESNEKQLYRKNGDLVQIGDKLAHRNAYLGDLGTTYVENDTVFAAVTGILVINPVNRTIKINAHNQEKRLRPKKHEIVLGAVSSIRKSSVGILIQKVNDNILHNNRIYGNIHISNVARSYVDNLDTIFQKTDIIKAEVLRTHGSEWELATNKPKLGVIYSECKYCGTTMRKQGRDRVVCPFCGNTERKKLSIEFGILGEHSIF